MHVLTELLYLHVNGGQVTSTSKVIVLCSYLDDEKNINMLLVLRRYFDG